MRFVRSIRHCERIEKSAWQSINFKKTTILFLLVDCYALLSINYSLNQHLTITKTNHLTYFAKLLVCLLQTHSNKSNYQKILP